MIRIIWIFHSLRGWLCFEGLVWFPVFFLLSCFCLPSSFANANLQNMNGRCRFLNENSLCLVFLLFFTCLLRLEFILLLFVNLMLNVQFTRWSNESTSIDIIDNHLIFYRGSLHLIMFVLVGNMKTVEISNLCLKAPKFFHNFCWKTLENHWRFSIFTAKARYSLRNLIFTGKIRFSLEKTWFWLGDPNFPWI